LKRYKAQTAIFSQVRTTIFTKGSNSAITNALNESEAFVNIVVRTCEKIAVYAL